ncbi:MAG: flagellar hook-length control protein FliK [Desulfotignum sp.]
MIPAIHVSSAAMKVINEKGPSDPTFALKNNQIVQARVVQMQPPNQARLVINGQEISVKTNVMLPPGQDIQLKVQVGKDGIILRLTTPFQPGVSKQPAPLLQFFSRPDTLGALFKTDQAKLFTILENMALKSSRRDDGFLPRLMEKGGLMLEKKLADVLINQTSGSVKQGVGPGRQESGRQESGRQESGRQSPGSQGQGSQSSASPLMARQQMTALLDTIMAQDFKGEVLKQALSAVGGQGKDTGTDAARGLLHTIENLQVLNSQSAESGRYLLPFPVLADAGFNLGQLLVDVGEDADTAGEKKMIRVSLLLDMSSLGPVRADVSILDKAVTGRFLLQNEDTRAFAASMIPMLKKQLADIDFQLLKMDCQVAAPADIAANCLVETLFNRRDDQVLHIVI